MFAMFLVVMILFVALAIDLGYAYVTKANLSKAVDAAALRGMLNIAKGTTTAAAIAQSVFQANYKTSGRDNGGTLPVPTVTFNPDPPVAGAAYANQRHRDDEHQYIFRSHCAEHANHDG